MNGLETVACNLCGSDSAKELYASNLDAPGGVNGAASSKLSSGEVPRSGASDSRSHGDSSRADRLRCTDRALGRHGRIVQCRSCGLVYVSPREPAQAILDAYGSVEDPTYLEEERGRIETFRGSLRLLDKFKRPPGSLLDIGCCTGLFLSLAREQGWAVAGVEPSLWACRVARQRYQVEVHPGTLSALNLSAQTFDVATMWDSLEHYTDPMGELQRACRLLRPDGILALTTIDVGSPIARVLKKRWWWFMEMHLYYFTRKTVTALMEQAGFDVLAIRSHVRTISVRYLWSRLEPWLGGALTRSLSRFGERLRVNGAHLPVALGDVMTVVARRRP